MKKLGINTAAGVLDIIAAILYFLGLIIIVFSSFVVVVSSGETSAEEILLDVFEILLLVYTVVCIVVHIVGLVKSAKAKMYHLTGNILGIIAHCTYLLSIFLIASAGAGGDEILFISSIVIALYTFILVAFSAVFTLKDNKIPIQHIGK